MPLYDIIQNGILEKSCLLTLKKYQSLAILFSKRKVLDTNRQEPKSGPTYGSTNVRPDLGSSLFAILQKYSKWNRLMPLTL